MIDLHTHSIFSDGVLVPSELVRRAEALGIAVIGVTDHADASNLDFIVPRLVAVAAELNQANTIKMIPGVELTHVPPSQIERLAAKARSLGAGIIVVHGETIAEPVAVGTNGAGLGADIDILAHPGLIAAEEVKMAAENGILLEISARKGHSLTNGHVARLAKELGAGMVINTDAHEPSDLIGKEQALRIALGAALSPDDFEAMQANAHLLASRFLSS